MQKKAFITGITGQDGSYLAELLLEKGYEVHGLRRRSSLDNTARITGLYRDDQSQKHPRFFMHHGDLTDSTNLVRLLSDIQPDEIYNLAAMSHVHVSFETPEYTANADGIGTLRLLEAVRILKLQDKTRLYQASTSELYGLVQDIPQTEKTPFYPRSPYAVAKLYAFWMTKNYREAYNMYACNGILFNHESPRRGETFVTRKITLATARIALGLQEVLHLGNLNARRDWGHAKDYVEAMYLMLQQDQPEDYVIATGHTTPVRDFARKSFAHLGIQLSFRGQGLAETGVIDSIDEALFTQITGQKPSHLKAGQALVAVDPSYFRPAEVDLLIGNAEKARSHLGWTPRHTLDQLVKEMVLSDVAVIKRQAAV